MKLVDNTSGHPVNMFHYAYYLISVPCFSVSDVHLLLVMCDHVRHAAIVPDHLGPGGTAGTYEWHHERVTVDIGQLIPPYPYTA